MNRHIYEGIWRLADPKISITSLASMTIGGCVAARDGSIAFAFGASGLALGAAIVFLQEPAVFWIGMAGLILGCSGKVCPRWGEAANVNWSCHNCIFTD